MKKIFITCLLFISFYANSFAQPDQKYKFTINSVELIKIPEEKPTGIAWDAFNGPDIYFRIADSVKVYYTSKTIDDMEPEEYPIIWNTGKSVYTGDINYPIFIQFYDNDDPQEPDLIWQEMINPISYFDGKNASSKLVISPKNDMQFVLNVSWTYNLNGTDTPLTGSQAFYDIDSANNARIAAGTLFPVYYRGKVIIPDVKNKVVSFVYDQSKEDNDQDPAITINWVRKKDGKFYPVGYRDGKIVKLKFSDKKIWYQDPEGKGGWIDSGYTFPTK